MSELTREEHYQKSPPDMDEYGKTMKQFSNRVDTTKLSIREIDRKIARDMIIKNHYSQKSTNCSVAIGLY